MGFRLVTDSEIPLSAVTRLVLIPSPLTGPHFCSPTLDALWRCGQRSVILRITDTEYIFPPFWLTQAASLAGSLPDEDDVILVAFGGAGMLLPAIAKFSGNRKFGARVVGCIFIDSDLPKDGANRFDVSSDRSFKAYLQERSKHGWLPQWNEDALALRIEDPQRRKRFIQTCPRVPTALYEESVTVPTNWPDIPCGYLDLTGEHSLAVEEAEAGGWEVTVLKVCAFAPLLEPEIVADALVELCSRLRV